MSGKEYVAQHLNISATIEDLLLVWEVTEAEEQVGQLGFLRV
jgi:hypothetical protein